MKDINEIHNRIEELNNKIITLYVRKRRTKSLSIEMQMIDTDIDKRSSEIKSLKWVLNSK